MIPIDGGAAPCNPSVTTCDSEGTLDFEWAAAMANSFSSAVNSAEIYLYDAVNPNTSTFMDVFNQILTDDHARVLSTSWGCAEVECYDTGSMDSDNAIFNQMAGQGWTLIAASDDNGATAKLGGSAGCATFDAVEYPASDPNVIAAGGTTLFLNANATFNSELGWTGGTSSGSCARNDGGSGGGCSVHWPAPSYQGSNPLCGVGSRSLPDIALNADGVNTPQYYYYQGSLQPTGGTSIVAPELAGFFAQENAYLLYVGSIVGDTCGGSFPCSPVGNANYYMYYEGLNAPYAAHYPFYDIRSGCNSNDVTAVNGLGYYCAGIGYDAVTGWGSVNMLQLAWSINTYLAGDFGAPSVIFAGPPINRWYNSDQFVNWTIADTSANGSPPTGVAGFTVSWDSIPNDSYSEPTPGFGDSFYTGPQYPNATTGSFNLASAGGQGCHTLNILAWDNTGYPSGDQTYGPLCYDTTAPITTATLSGTLNGSIYISPVSITLNANDNLSGVISTVYQTDGGLTQAYTGPFVVSTNGIHTVTFHSVDRAGNIEAAESTVFTIDVGGNSSSAQLFVPVPPCRIADTRNPPGPFGGPSIQSGSSRDFVVAGGLCGIPPAATAFSLNVTVVPSGTLGYLTVWPSGEAQPTVSTLNSTDGRVKASAAIVPAGRNGSVSVFATNTTNVVLDIDGYFIQSGSSASGLAFYPLTPCRVADTRATNGPLGGPSLVASAPRNFPIRNSSCDIPANAEAYSLNFTAVPKGPLGYVSVWPTGQSQPLVSTLNAPTGTITANAAIVPAGSDGDIDVFATSSTHLVIDVTGYFAPPGAGGLSLYNLTPCRVLDTRSLHGSAPFTGQLTINVFGSGCSVPSNAQAYAFNSTVVPPASLGFLTLWSQSQSQPVVSTLNALDGAITSNMAIVPTNNGSIDAFADGYTQLILDISGYFAP